VTYGRAVQVVLGLCGGVVAGFVTGWLSGRRERGAWLRDKRYELYTRFLDTALTVHGVLLGAMRHALMAKDLQRTSELMAECGKSVASLHDQIRAMEIIAPAAVTSAAARVAVDLSTTLVAAVPAQMGNDKFNHTGWLAVLRTDGDAIATFQDAAGRGLGLTRREVRRRRRRRASTSLQAANEAFAVSLIEELEGDGTILGHAFLGEKTTRPAPPPGS
jgi:hypothetical protein